jgi:hypothetical protein
MKNAFIHLYKPSVGSVTFDSSQLISFFFLVTLATSGAAQLFFSLYLRVFGVWSASMPPFCELLLGGGGRQTEYSYVKHKFIWSADL